MARRGDRDGVNFDFIRMLRYTRWPTLLWGRRYTAKFTLLYWAASIVSAFSDPMLGLVMARIRERRGKDMTWRVRNGEYIQLTTFCCEYTL